MLCNDIKKLTIKISKASLSYLMMSGDMLIIKQNAYDKDEYYLTLKNEKDVENKNTIECEETNLKETHEPPLTDKELKALRIIIKDCSRILKQL